MRTLKLAASLSAALVMQACGAPASEEPSRLATSAAALTTAVSRGCTFTLTYKEVMPPFPPTYVPVVTRQASSTCPWGAGSVELPGAYSVPQLSLAANDLGVAVSYTNKYSPSGSSGTWLELRHVAPDTLAVVRSVTLSAHVNFSSGHMYSGELSILTDGTTLKVRGEKAGILGGETGSGNYYVATFPNFFTSTTAPAITASTAPEPTSVGSWSVTGGLASARSGHTATLLNGTGDVLVVSGPTAEVFNPYSNVSVPTAAPIYARTKHTATPLSSSTVLVAGGWIGSAPLYWRRTAEVYDQTTGTWTATSNTMSTPRGNHTATLLDSGKVLVVGGYSTEGETNTAELYDPATNTWSPAASALTASDSHTATLLYSGKVLVTGGKTYASGALRNAQEYDPATNTWSRVDSMPRARSGHVAVRLYSGTVMVLGGGHDAVDFYDPYNATPWYPGPTLSGGASAISATLLYSGEVLVTHSTGQASLYDPAANAWLSAGSLSAPLPGHATTFLHSGQVLVTGGFTSGSDVTTAQRYTR
ncbi:galactose oxidase-like protein [Archangium gephyra]|uniref:Branched-chain amino acid ABC transporter, amino acid-binding protein n=1 Tax=Archangium gephyra TaxID=48 RepID=A0AAC8TB92_9BACT|nr:kelch repeat-containing protein [Archangium gephyra]AKI99576.1 Branched-chain amino acid ABC transporter, amino acid-binding protein [Archangium gephyra]REG27887.1 galactose oxidase-like protein [Archangium gephyra]